MMLTDLSYVTDGHPDKTIFQPCEDGATPRRAPRIVL